MMDQWYGDNRDLVKWTVLREIANRYQIANVVQVLYYSPTDWGQIEIDGTEVSIPTELLKHFRDVDSICGLDSELKIDTFNEPFTNRETGRRNYLDSLIGHLRNRNSIPGLVFLDPDTGLEPASGNFNSTHVREIELQEVWAAPSSGDVLVFYQHKDNRAGQEWIERKRMQFATALKN